jgi:hypothetical protein
LIEISLILTGDKERDRGREEGQVWYSAFEVEEEGRSSRGRLNEVVTLLWLAFSGEKRGVGRGNVTP